MNENRPSKRAYRCEEEMFPLIESWESSEQSQQAFCKAHSLPIAVFGYWLRRYREEKRRPAKKVQGFVSIEMEASPGESVLAEIHYPDGTRLVFKEPVGLGFLQGLLPNV